MSLGKSGLLMKPINQFYKEKEHWKNYTYIERRKSFIFKNNKIGLLQIIQKKTTQLLFLH